MKVKRMTEVETNRPKIGDRISVGHYTATCQKLTPKGALFLLDQYLDEAYQMGPIHGKGGYEASELRYKLNLDGLDEFPEELRERMVPFDNGDLLSDLPECRESFHEAKYILRHFRKIRDDVGREEKE